MVEFDSFWKTKLKNAIIKFELEIRDQSMRTMISVNITIFWISENHMSIILIWADFGMDFYCFLKQDFKIILVPRWFIITLSQIKLASNLKVS